MNHFHLDPLKSPIAPITGATTDPVVVTIISVGMYVYQHILHS
jgi:hypothetical protein